MAYTQVPVSLGTTIMACKFGGGNGGDSASGVVLCADSRTSTGAYIANKVADKISQLAEDIWICRSGSAADTQAVTEYVRNGIRQHCSMQQRPCTVFTAAQLCQQIAYNNKSRLSAGMIVAGYDSEKGGSVYGIPLGGTLAPTESYAIGGSGSTYIYAYCEKFFPTDAPLTREGAIEFCRKAVMLATMRDGSSGGCVRMMIVDSAGSEKRFYRGNERDAYEESRPATNQ